jgi:adenylosuccinate synthase
LLLSKKAHIILPSHKLLDAALEHSKGATKIGSTLKGIGPTYTDKIARTGLRIGNILQDDFAAQYQKLKENHLHMAASLDFDINSAKLDGQTFEAYEEKWFEGVEFLRKLRLTDSEIFINKALRDQVDILAEGAQGSLLDIDFGSYPFVTSSTTIAAGACSGLGLAPSAIGEVYGIFKAYCTRVGSGPFPTELCDETGERLRKEGNEFGSTTGRPRRCGWLDLPALKYSVMLNGVTQLIMTKVDVLNILDSFQVCVAYQYEGKQIDYIPFDFNPERLTPVYKTMKGWSKSLENFTTFDQLPSEVMDYVKVIEDFVEVPVTIISTGPNRLQTIRK